MKPLTYGYMRVFCDATEEDVRSVMQRIQECAEALGFQLATTFQETVSGSHQVFGELIEEIQRSGAVHVIAPSFNHFSKHGILQRLLLERLEEDTAVEVHTLREWARSTTPVSVPVNESNKQPLTGRG